MADLTPLDEKLGEVLGLAQAAQAATKTVREMEGAERFADDLDAHARAGRRDRAPDGRPRRRARGPQDRHPREGARHQAEATEMMETYLGGEEEALDGFEFLSMAEAGELVPLGDRPDDGARPSARTTRTVSPSGPSASSGSTSRPSAGPHWPWPPTRSGRPAGRRTRARRHRGVRRGRGESGAAKESNLPPAGCRRAHGVEVPYVPNVWLQQASRCAQLCAVTPESPSGRFAVPGRLHRPRTRLKIAEAHHRAPATGVEDAIEAVLQGAIR